MLTNAGEVLSSKNASNLLDKLLEIEHEIGKLEAVKTRAWNKKAQGNQFSPAWAALLWHSDQRLCCARAEERQLLYRLIDG